MRDQRLIHFARQLRKESTDAERRIWSLLRAHRLRGHSFRRQHPIAGYIADFYCHAARLAVELDGGQHADPSAVEYDARRTAAIKAEGVEVIRFSDVEALKETEAVVERILLEVERRLADRPPPSPSPGGPGEGTGRQAPSPGGLGEETGRQAPSPGGPGEGTGRQAPSPGGLGEETGRQARSPGGPGEGTRRME